jgi:hypothetical protein
VDARSTVTLRTLFYLYVAITLVHIGYVVYCEPFAFDAWNVAVDSHAEPISISRFFAFWYQQYTESNPRIGQPLAYLTYKTVGTAEILTPLAYLAVVVGGFVVALGRLPRRQNGADLATIAIGIGFLWFAAPNFPAYMFCRAYATNYLWAAAVQVWFIAALRLHVPVRHVGPVKLLGIFLLGVVAGMGNEHVGPTLILVVAGFAIVHWRRTREHSPFRYAALLGLVTGYALIFFAPGQNQRYDGLAEKFTLTQQILVRGLKGNLDIMQGMLYAASPLLVLLVFIVASGLMFEGREESQLGTVRKEQRDALAVIGWTLLAGALMTITLFASPKLGPRFYIHPMFALLAGVLGVTRTFLHRRRSFAPFVVLAGLASSYAIGRTVPLFHSLKEDSDTRLAELEATPAGGVYTAQAWEQVGESWWFLGDDARDQKKRELIADYFALDRVLFRGGNMWSTLGLTDVKLVMQYRFEPDLCVDELEGLDLKPYIGRDIGALHHAFLDAITEVQNVTSAKLRTMDLVVTFLATPPPLPRPRTYLARWRNGVMEGYTAQMARIGRTKDRKLELAQELRSDDWEIFLVAIGDPPRRLGLGSQGTFIYQPWRTAQYWALACKPEHCFVIFTASHGV